MHFNVLYSTVLRKCVFKNKKVKTKTELQKIKNKKQISQKLKWKNQNLGKDKTEFMKK